MSGKHSWYSATIKNISTKTYVTTIRAIKVTDLVADI